MGQWWNTIMADAGQAMYTDPQLALQMGTVPENLLTSPENYQKTMKAAQSERSGFWGGVLNFLGNVDGALGNIPSKVLHSDPVTFVGSGLWYPVDKIAQGARWLYSEGFSQPMSTLLLQAARDDLEPDYDFWSFENLKESYAQAEHISPGQAMLNYENVKAASGDPGALALPFGLAEAPNLWSAVVTGDNWKYTGSLTPEEREQVKRQQERFIYDTKYWQRKETEKYNKGSGALDFYFVIFGDPTAPVIGAVSNTVKAARSAQFVDDGLGEMVRTRGNLLDVASTTLPGAKGAPQTLGEYANSTRVNKFYDWVASPGLAGERKTAAEIAAHPIWGRGRRKNPFANQWGEALAKADRDEMNMILRFSLGDNQAAKELAAKGGGMLDEIGRLSDNRKMLAGAKFDEEMLSYFVAREDAYPAAALPETNRLFTPPPPPGPGATPQQLHGYQARWGALAEKAKLMEMHERAARAVAGNLNGIRNYRPVGGINQEDMVAVSNWRSSQVALIDEEIGRLQGQVGGIYANLLGPNLGKAANELTTSDMNMFGTLERAYRMGEFGIRSAEKAAGKKFMKQTRGRKGEFVSQGLRRGFYGTPVRVLSFFGDRVPEGRINHNDDDALDRLSDMLKQVPDLSANTRTSYLDRYVTAGDKVGKSKELEKIHSDIIMGMAMRKHNLDPEVAEMIANMVKVGVGETMSKLTMGRTRGTAQAFSAAKAQGSARTADYIKDGEAWILAPLAKTQLSISDTLLPIREIDEILTRSSGAMKSIRAAGGTAMDAVTTVADGLSGIWKASALIRGAYTPRMISEELFASAIKFGMMSRLIADPSVGMKNFVRNRAVWAGSEMGLTSHVPTTGAGAGSRFAKVKLTDEALAEKVSARRDELKQLVKQTNDPLKKAQIQAELKEMKTSRISINRAVPIVQARISMEKELADNLQKDITRWQGDVKRLEKSQDAVSQLRIQALQDKITVAQDQILDHQNIIQESVEYSDELLRLAEVSKGKRLFEGEFEAFGRKIPQAFSGEWANTISRESLSSDDAFKSIYARYEAIDVGRAIRTGSWDYVSPDQPNHMAAWLRAINFQWRQDDVFRLVAEDPTGKKAMDFLRTPEGRNHLRDLGPRARVGAEQLVKDVKVTLDKYLPVEALQQKMARGEEVSAADLSASISKQDFPVVHGEEVKMNTRMFAKDTSGNIVDRIIAKSFERLGSIPSDLMSRHPVYARLFEARYRTVMGQEIGFKKSEGLADEFTPEELEKIKVKADKLARKDMSQVVYDPKRTTASEALRFIFPFFNAHADSLARWGGLVGEKPQFLTTTSKIYNAPVAAHMITDEQGNVVGSDGFVTKKVFKDGKEKAVRERVTLNERVLHLRVPWETKPSGSVPVRLSAMNTILPGDPWFNPGTGPLVQVAGSRIAKASPQFGDFLQWSKVLPYGPTDTVTAITPKYMRAIWDRYKAGDPDGEEYQKAYLAVYNKKVAEYHESDGKKKFTLKEIDEEAKSFLNLAILEAWGSPAQTKGTPLTGTPYQFYVDQYRQMMEADPQSARDLFLERYPEYFSFTASLNKSMGIAATHSADSMAKKYKDLLEMDPEMAPFIIGNIKNGGAFSSSVYKAQFEESFGGQWVREHITAQDAISANQAEQGWAEWRQMKTLLDSALIRAGLRSYSEGGAERLNQMRKNVIESLSTQYPGWGEAFFTTDRDKIQTRVKSFERLVQDERFQNDPLRANEMSKLMEYLQGRRLIKAELERRGASQLSFDVMGDPTGENADLGQIWNSFTTRLINEDTSFNWTFNRYLVNDHLQ